MTGFCRSVAAALVVEPIDRFHGLVFHDFERLPWTKPVDDLGLEQPDNSFGKRIVVWITDASHGGFDARLRKAPIVADADALHSPVAAMNEALGQSAGIQCLLQSVEKERRSRVPADSAAYNSEGVDINNEGDISKTTPDHNPGLIPPGSAAARFLVRAAALFCAPGQSGIERGRFLLEELEQVLHALSLEPEP